MSQRFESFEEFWPFYVRRHTNKINRALHFVGTSVALGCVAVAIVKRRPVWALAAPVVGYGLAWAGHLLVEKNAPFTFSHPLYELRAAVRMWAKTVSGTMNTEIERAVQDAAAVSDSVEAQPTNGPGSSSEPLN